MWKGTGKIDFIHKKRGGLTYPGLTSPGLTSRELTSPELTSPELTSQELTSPELTSQELTSPEFSTTINVSYHPALPGYSSTPFHISATRPIFCGPLFSEDSVRRGL